MKMLIAVTAIAVMLAAAVMALKALWPAKKGGGRKVGGAPAGAGRGKGPQEARVEEDTQSLVRFSEFAGHCAVRTDGVHVIFIEVDGHNLGFATPEERDADAEALGIALAGERHPYRIHRCQRPIDAGASLELLKGQLEGIEEESLAIRAGQTALAGFAAEKRVAALEARRRLIEEVYLPQAAGAGETKYETDVYITMGFEDAPDAVPAAEREAAAFIALLAGAGYSARVCEPDAVIEKIVNYYGRFPGAEEQRNAWDPHGRRAS